VDAGFSPALDKKKAWCKIVEWLSTALNNLLRVTTDFHAKSPRAARDLGALIRAKGADLATRYKLYRTGTVPGTHECVAHPNYIIVDRVRPRLGRVQILRISTPRKSRRRLANERLPEQGAHEMNILVVDLGVPSES
jgi:toxin ParE1/3/4